MTLGAIVLVAVLATVTWTLVVPRVRVDDEAPDFARLVDRRSTLLVACVAVLTAQVLWLVEPGHLWVWVAYLGFGVPMVAVDLRTTYLPRQLHRLTAGAMATALVFVALTDWRTALGSLVAAVAVHLFFLAVWRLGRGLGFGDVRLAGLTGAVSGLGSAADVATAVLIGTLLGAFHGIGHALWARRAADRPRHFAYGPALWSGPLLGLLFAAAAFQSPADLLAGGVSDRAVIDPGPAQQLLA